jgi:hypothetical protein
VGFEVVTAVVMSSFFWDITPGNPLKVGDVFLRNVRRLLTGYMALYPRRQKELFATTPIE